MHLMEKGGWVWQQDFREDIEVTGVPITQYGNKRKMRASKEEEGEASGAAGTVCASRMGEGENIIETLLTSQILHFTLSCGCFSPKVSISWAAPRASGVCGRLEGGFLRACQTGSTHVEGGPKARDR